MDKITVIIPVYNVEMYLRRCIDSVINQTYRNLEIICIDDGSTDSSGIILDEYAQTDDRIIVIHQRNNGVSAARNKALDIMSGKYVSFIDGDDWIENEFYQEAYETAKKNNVDIFCSGIYRDINDTCIKMENEESVRTDVFERSDILLYAFKRDSYKNFGAYLWNKLFSADLFDDIRFDEELKTAEDILVLVECVVKGEKFIYTDKAYYHYFQRESSAIHSRDLNAMDGLLFAYEKAIKKIQNSDIPEIKDTIKWLKRFYVYHASNLAEMAIEQKNDEKLKFYKQEIRRYIDEYIKTNMHFSERIDRINAILNYQEE